MISKDELTRLELIIHETYLKRREGLSTVPTQILMNEMCGHDVKIPIELYLKLLESYLAFKKAQ
jgi:hypothetical protein